MQENKWSTGLRCDLAEACSYKDKLVEPTVHIPLNVYMAIRQLCKDVKVEWQMFLLGSQDGNNYQVTNYFIPKQIVTEASVEDDDNISVAWYKENNCIGTLHSHGNMGVFFSATDDTNNKNSPVPCHVVVNNADEYVACVRTTLPCGMEAFVACKVMITIPAEQRIVVAGFENIQTRTSSHFPNHKKVSAKERDNYYGPESVCLGIDQETGKPMWGTQEDLDQIESEQYKDTYGDRGEGYPTLEQIDRAIEEDEKYNKKKGKQGLYPWGKV